MLATIGAFLLGLPTVGRILAAIIETSAPIVKVAVEFLTYYAKILWKGLTDIFDSMATIVTVLSLLAGVYFYASSLNKETYIETKCIDRTTGKRVTNYRDAAYDRFKNIFQW